MKKNYFILLLLVWFSTNLIHAQFDCPQLIGNQSTTTSIVFKITSGTCANYPSVAPDNKIFVTYQGNSATFAFSSCNGTNLKYNWFSGDNLPSADSFIVLFPGRGTCQYQNGTLVTLSGNDVSFSDKVAVYPNPLIHGDYLNIKFKSNLSAKFEMYNVTGKMVLTDAVINEDEKKIDTRSLTNGIYMLKISNDEASATRKVVIMN